MFSAAGSDLWPAKYVNDAHICLGKRGLIRTKSNEQLCVQPRVSISRAYRSINASSRIDGQPKVLHTVIRKLAIRNRSNHNETRRAVLLLSTGTFFVQAISVLLSPVFTRLYSPADYGIFGLYTALITMCGPFMTLSYETAIYIEKDDGAAIQLGKLCLVATMATTTGFALALALCGDRFLSILHASSLRPLAWLVCLGITIRGAATVLTAWAIRRKSFKQMAGYAVSQNVIYNAVQMACGVLRTGGLGLIFGDVVGYAGSCYLYSRLYVRQDRDLLSRHPTVSIVAIAKRYIRFPVMLVPSCFLGKAVASLPALWLAAVYGPSVVGLYGLAYRLLLAPIDLFTGSIAQVYRATLAQLYRDRPDEVPHFFYSTLRRLAMVAVPILLLIASIGPPVVGFLFGSRWHEAGVYVKILSPYVLCAVIVSPLSSIFDVFERQDLDLAFGIVRFGLIVGTFWLAQRLHWSVVWCLGAYSATMCVAYGIMLGLLVHLVRRLSLATLEPQLEQFNGVPNSAPGDV